jgi:hypothetical protein
MSSYPLFPSGNANTYFDYAHAQIVGACMRGNELQSAGDAPFLERLGFPKELITSNEAEYGQVAERLIRRSCLAAKAPRANLW